MATDSKVPFVANATDDLHCLQAAYSMVRQHFLPQLSIPDKEWDKITGFEKDKGTWASAALLWFADQGLHVRHITLFDYQDFVAHGGDYLIREYGKDVGEWQVKHTNMPVERKRAERLMKEGTIEKREPTLADITDALDAGSLCRALVNACLLNGRDGYAGHAVIVKGYDKQGVIIHDPGLPPMPDRHIAYDLFEAAWTYPNKESKELDIIGLAQ